MPKPFAERLGLRVFRPKSNAKKLQARVNLNGTLDELEVDPSVTFESLAGINTGKPVGIVRSDDRVSLLFADSVQNIPKEKLPLAFRLLGMGGGPKVIPPFKLLFVAAKKALKVHLEYLAAPPGLTRLVPCHGTVTNSDPAGSLKNVATSV